MMRTRNALLCTKCTIPVPNGKRGKQSLSTDEEYLGPWTMDMIGLGAGVALCIGLFRAGKAFIGKNGFPNFD